MRIRRLKAVMPFIAVLAVLAAAGPMWAQAYTPETKAQRDARMKWWRDARFGMFIHWGVYAVPAGTYHGKQIPDLGEWIMKNAQIPVAEYRQFARQFNPVHYDPDAWAELARQAGMKYIVITSKHHDGFALFPSDASQWDIADASPYGKDLIGPLARAAHQRGLRFGCYYSQAQDWNNPGGATAREPGHNWD
jgi:alpha-L-fucosidase